ncbi:MAG: hypothetical protein K1Y36_18350 [Blastocatellia bacterium]|nr:hypothetical protein [Blastocatellia bacterium]
MRRTLILIPLVWVALSAVSFGQRQAYQIPPVETDPQINVRLEPHYVAVNPAMPSRNQLFVFFPGTDANPAFYKLIVNHAADLGFHAVGLNYPNSEAANDVCGGANDDLDCYGKVRLEVLDGTDRSPLVTVDRPNSIENRLVKLLMYLHNRFPNDGWGQFLDSNQAIKWPSLVVSGHSQGGGHAGIIGRYHPVARVVMFAAMDFNVRTLSPANWIAKPELTPNATPPDRFFGFSHQRDERINFQILTGKVWPAYGLSVFGTVVNVDTMAAPFAESHTLTSNLESQNSQVPLVNPYHSIVVVDAGTPKLADGTPRFAPVWTYLLTGATESVRDMESPVVSNIELSRTKVKPRKDPTLVISWRARDNLGIIRQDLTFAADGVNFVVPVVAGLPQNIQLITWRVPVTVPKTTNGRVKILAVDAAGNSGEAISIPITIK